MKCPNCNAENENNSKFCTSCGSPIPQPTAQGSSYEGAQYPPQAQNQYVPVGSSEAQGAPYQQQQPQYQPPQQAQQQQYQPTPVPAVQPYQVQPSTDTGNGNDGKPKKQKSKKGVKINRYCSCCSFNCSVWRQKRGNDKADGLLHRQPIICSSVIRQ